MKKPRIAVLLSQKPRFDYLLIDKQTGRVDLEGASRILGRVNRHPLEEALRLKQEHDGHVTLYAVDIEGKDEGIREALASGADDAIVISSKAVSGADLHAKANLLARAITVHGDADLILSGTYASEASWGIVAGEVAAVLDRPLLASARNLKIEDSRLHATIPLGDDEGIVSAPLPAVASIGEEANKPRYPTSWGVADAFQSKELKWWHLSDMDVDGRMLAKMGSRTEILRQALEKDEQRGPEVIREDIAQAGRLAAKRLSRHGFLGGP